MSKQLDSRPLDLWSFILNMSSSRKEKVKFTWGSFTAILLIVIFGGVIDIRRCIEALNKLPEIQQTLEQNSRDIRDIHDVMRRNKIVLNSPGSTDISTAQYNE